MKRFVSVVFAVAVLGFGAAACGKLHSAGNDRLGIAGGRIAAVSAAPVLR